LCLTSSYSFGVFFRAQGKHQAFESVPMSLMRTFAMMLGEIDFLNTYVHSYNQRGGEGERTLPFPLITFIILGVFMVFMPILLMNLLIGLAVGDIESVRRNAQLKRLAMQVKYIFVVNAPFSAVSNFAPLDLFYKQNY